MARTKQIKRRSGGPVTPRATKTTSRRTGAKTAPGSSSRSGKKPMYTKQARRTQRISPLLHALSFQDLRIPANAVSKFSRRPYSPSPTTPLQTRHDRPARDTAVPAINRPPHAETPLLTPRPRNMRRHPTTLGGHEFTMAEPSNPGAAGGRRGISRSSIRGHEPVRDTCETGHNHAEGHTISEENSGSMGWVRVDGFLRGSGFRLFEH
jgi:hypothetical protein